MPPELIQRYTLIKKDDWWLSIALSNEGKKIYFEQLTDGQIKIVTREKTFYSSMTVTVSMLLNRMDFIIDLLERNNLYYKTRFKP